LLYHRTEISILRKHPPAPTSSLPWLAATPENPVITLSAEVRDGMTLYNQQGWFNLDSPSEKSGVLMAFSAPGVAPIIPMAQYAPLDILLVDSEGTITQILPSITLARLDKDIMPANPILAFLFLKGGACQSLGIGPGDSVEYKIFKQPPVILGSAPAATTQLAPIASKPPIPAKNSTPPTHRDTSPLVINGSDN